MDSLSDIWSKSADEIKLDELIDVWHQDDSEISLIEFLGVTSAEYAAWIEGRITASELLKRGRHG